MGLVGCGDPIAATGDTAGASTTGGTSPDETTSGSTGETTGGTTAEGPCAPGAPRSCFPAPPGIEPVAPCVAGVEICTVAGEWGTCYGAILPTAQDCTTPEDETCSGAGPCGGVLRWARAVEVLGEEHGVAIPPAAVAIAPDGAIIVTGALRGAVNWDGEKVGSQGQADVWAARFSAAGEREWLYNFPGDEVDDDSDSTLWSAGNVDFTADGDLLLIGHSLDTIDFGQGPQGGEDGEAVAVRMTPLGAVEWGRRFPLRSHFDRALTIAPAGAGEVWLAGTLHTSADLGGGDLYSHGHGDVVLARFTGDGEHLWSRRYGDPGHQEVRAAAEMPDGGLVIAGHLEGELDLGGTTIASAGQADAFVARLSGDGSLLWAQRFGDNFMQHARTVNVGADGRILVTGHFVSSIDLGGGPFVTAKLPSEYDPDWKVWQQGIFIAELSQDGEHLWSSALIAPGESTYLDSVDRGPDGTIALSGWGAPLFTGPTWGAEGDAWIAVLTAGGDHQWMERLDTSGGPHVAVTDDGAVIAAFHSGELVVQGTTVGSNIGLTILKLGP